MYASPLASARSSAVACSDYLMYDVRYTERFYDGLRDLLYFTSLHLPLSHQHNNNNNNNNDLAHPLRLRP